MIRALVVVFGVAAGIGPFAVSGGHYCARAVLHTYEAKIRLKGRVSTTQVKASDAGHAKKLVQAQYGPSVTVLSVKKVD